MNNIRTDLPIQQPLLPVPSDVHASLGAKSLLHARVFAETLAVFVKHVNGEKHSSFWENSPFHKDFPTKNARSHFSDPKSNVCRPRVKHRLPQIQSGYRLKWTIGKTYWLQEGCEKHIDCHQCIVYIPSHQFKGEDLPVKGFIEAMKALSGANRAKNLKNAPSQVTMCVRCRKLSAWRSRGFSTP